MFNFQKADTPGVFAGPGGAVLAMSGMKWLLGHSPKEKEEKDENDGKYTSTQSSKPVQERLRGLTVPGSSDNTSENEGETGRERRRVGSRSNEIESNPEEDTPTQQRSRDGGRDTIQENSSDEEMAINENHIEPEANIDEREEDNTEEELPAYFGDYSDEQTMKYLEDKAYEESMNNSLSRRYSKLYDRLNLRHVDEAQRHEMLNEFRKKEAERLRKEVTTFGVGKKAIKGYAGKVGAKVGGATAGFGRGMAGVGRNYIDKQNERFTRASKNGIKRMAGIAAGATFGMAGMAAGIASGNPSQVLQNTSIGAAAGYKFGSGVGGAGANTISESKEAFERGRLGEEEYAKRKAKEYQLQVADDEKIIKLIQQKMKKSRREARDLSREMVPKYMDAKVTDIDEMIKLEKFRTSKQYKDNKGETRYLEHGEVAQLEKLRKMYNMRPEDKDNKKESITKNMMKNMKIDGTNISKETAESWQKMAREYMNYKEN